MMLTGNGRQLVEELAVPKAAHDEWMSVEETCRRLGVKRQTVYAYISRGRLRSRRSATGRGSEVHADDVEHLASLTTWRRTHVTEPVESAITLIRDGRLHYRGHEVSSLVRTEHFEDVALLLWGADPEEPPVGWTADPAVTQMCRQAARVLPATASPTDHLRLSAACAGSVLRPPDHAWTPAGRRYAATFLTTAVGALPTLATVDETSFAAMLWSRLSPREPTPELVHALDTALMLLADHDLPESTRVVRIAARAGVDLAGVVRLGLEITGGPVKSATAAGLHNLLGAARSSGYRPRDGEPVPGFGHASYPDGDPRATLLLDLLTKVDPATVAPIRTALERDPLKHLPPPNIGFALTVLAHVAQMPPGAAEVLFTIARSAGWIAHAGEEYTSQPVRGVYHTVYSPPR